MKFMALPPPPRSFIGGAKYLKKSHFFHKWALPPHMLGKTLMSTKPGTRFVKCVCPGSGIQILGWRENGHIVKKNDLNLINRPHYFHI